MTNDVRPGSRKQAWRTLWRRLREPAHRPGAPLFGRISSPAALAFGAVLVLALILLADPASQRILPEWPRSLVHIASIVTNLGDSGYYLIPLGIVLIALAVSAVPLSRRLDVALRQFWLQLAFAFTAIAATGLIVNIGKRMIGRVRPLHVDPGSYLHFEPFSWRASNASLPSGHATTAWTLAAVLVLLCGPRLRPYVFVLGTLVCISRVVIGAHYPADVVAGALFGWFATLWFAHFLVRRGLVFRQNPDGTLALRGQDAAKTLFAAWRARR